MKYNGKGTLVHMVKEENRRKEILEQQRLNEAGQYFRDHPYQEKESDKYDVDFKTHHIDNTTGTSNDKDAQRDDPMIPKEKEVDQKAKDANDGKIETPEDPHNPKGLDFYMKKFNVSDKDDEGEAKLDSKKYVDCKMYKSK